MYPMHKFSAYVFDPSLGHDVINVIRKFLINPFNEIKLCMFVLAPDIL